MGSSRASGSNHAAQQRGNVGNALPARGDREGLDHRQGTLQPGSDTQIPNADPLTRQQWNTQATPRWRWALGPNYVHDLETALQHHELDSVGSHMFESSFLQVLSVLHDY